MDLSSKKTEIKCPKCKKQLNVTLGELKPGNKVKCYSCGSSITFQGDNVAKTIADIDKAFKNLSRKITFKM